jgi:hypothetical protein
MAQLPKVQAVAVDDTDARVRITQSLRFGLRIDVSLEQPASQSRCVWIEIIAESPNGTTLAERPGD